MFPNNIATFVTGIFKRFLYGSNNVIGCRKSGWPCSDFRPDSRQKEQNPHPSGNWVIHKSTHLGEAQWREIRWQVCEESWCSPNSRNSFRNPEDSWFSFQRRKGIEQGWKAAHPQQSKPVMESSLGSYFHTDGFWNRAKTEEGTDKQWGFETRLEEPLILPYWQTNYFTAV